MNIVIAQVFLKLQTVKDLVRPLTKKGRVITSFDSEHVKVSINTCEIFMRVLLWYFSILVERNDLGDISSIEVSNHTGVW